jgi:hypothetical protein
MDLWCRYGIEIKMVFHLNKFKKMVICSTNYKLLAKLIKQQKNNDKIKKIMECIFKFIKKFFFSFNFFSKICSFTYNFAKKVTTVKTYFNKISKI